MMRGGYIRRPQDEEEESAFVSMTDMTVSFLFIVMLLLAFFASQYSDKKTIPRPIYDTVVAARDVATDELKKLQARLAKLSAVDPLESYLVMSGTERTRILQNLQSQLRVDFPDLQVVISQEADALRFQGDGLFRSGASELRSDRRAIVETIAARLEEILPCYTLGPTTRWTSECNPGGAIIEAVQIEGHTDSDGSDNSNLLLSTARADITFMAMTAKEPNLVDHLNFRNQPVLSVAGYGKMRPVADNETVQGKATNRRIDLRIIMYTPSRFEEIARIRNALNRGVSGGSLK
jgi:outer membrane protein OmpA-like peptidoglycan-associated protein